MISLEEARAISHEPRDEETFNKTLLSLAREIEREIRNVAIRGITETCIDVKDIETSHPKCKLLSDYSEDIKRFLDETFPGFSYCLYWSNGTPGSWKSCLTFVEISWK